MSAFSGSLKTSHLSEILRKLVDARQTGCLELEEGGQEGFVALENGVILNAQTGSCMALQALFQFVQWREARVDFYEKPIRADLARDLAVYDPQVLITGVAYKEEEQEILQQAIPSLDAVPYYLGEKALEAVEATPADRGLLSMADGHRSVREIAEMVKLGPIEVAHILARFRLAGALEFVTPKPARSAMAAAG